MTDTTPPAAGSGYVPCPNCGTVNRADATRCYNCSHLLSAAAPADAPALRPRTPAKPDAAGYGAAGVVRVFAWLSLVVGVLGGLVIMATYGTVEAPIVPGYDLGTEEVSNPLAFVLGILSMIQGAVWCATGLALAAAAENSAALRLELWEMRNELRVRPGPGTEPAV